MRHAERIEAATGLIDRLRRRRREIMVVDVPGWDEPVGLVNLNSQEALDCHLDAEKLFGQRSNLLLADAWNAEVVYQTLALALVNSRHTPDGQVVRLFKSVDDLRKTLNAGEVGFLMDRYEEHPDRKLWQQVDKAGGVDKVGAVLADKALSGNP